MKQSASKIGAGLAARGGGTAIGELWRSLRPYRDQAHAFFVWWRDELVGLLPTALRRLAQSDRGFLLLLCGDVEFVLLHCHGAQQREIGRFDMDRDGAERNGDGAPADSPNARIAGLDLERLPIVLRLPRQQALCRLLDLPRTAEGELRRALGFQIDFVTPFKAQQVLFDHRVIARDSERLRVELWLATRAIIEKAVTQAKAWGLPPDIVDVVGDDPYAPSAFNLLPNLDAALGSGPWSIRNLALAALAAALTIAAFLTPLIETHGRLADLRQELRAAKTGAESTLVLQDKVDALATDLAFLNQRKARYPARVVVIEEVSRLLPDHTWLKELGISGEEVRLVGVSAAAAELLEELDRSAIFVAPLFRSPVTRDGGQDGERFNLSFKLTNREAGS